MANASTGGGGSAYGFDPSSSAPIRDYQLSGQGVQPFSNEDYVLHWTSHSFAGFTTNDGKADALRKVQSGIDTQALHDKTAAWQAIHSHVTDIHSRLQSAYNATFAAWSGDDADKAQTTFGHAVNSAAAMKDRAQGMHAGMTQISSGAQKLVGTSSDGPSTGAQIANAAIGFNIGGDGDGGHAVAAYDDFVTTLEGGRDSMPADYTWQVKTSPDATGGPGFQGSHNGGGGGGGVGGVSAPHLGSGSSAHQSVATPAMVHNPYTDGVSGGGTKPPKYPVEGPTHVQDPTDPLASATPFSGGSGSAGFDATPGLDTGSSLAGYDPSGGAGGAGLGGLGTGAGGGLAGGGLAGGGLGVGGGAGGGLGAGGGIGGGAGGAFGGGATGGAGGTLAGAGGLGNGAGGLAGEEAGVAQAGAAGRGGVGLPGQGVPRGVGGGGGDESERERSTWLEEDEDVWGESDAPPSVIS